MQGGVVKLLVPESDTGRPPEYGKVIEITLVKELGKLAPYVSNKGCLWVARPLRPQ